MHLPPAAPFNSSPGNFTVADCIDRKFSEVVRNPVALAIAIAAPADYAASSLAYILVSDLTLPRRALS